MIENKRGNIMISIFFFILSLGVVIAMIPTIVYFVNMAQQSNALNCQGYIYNGNPAATLSFNASLNNNQSGNGLACSAIKLYIPYILLVFLIFGVSKMLYSKAEDYFGGTGGAGG